MLKYLAVVAVVLGLAFYVSTQYKQHSENSAGQSKEPPAKALYAHANQQPESNVDQSQWNPPRWYRLFSWPDGIQAWGLFITLSVIAEQARLMGRQDKTVRDKERARISFVFPPAEGTDFDNARRLDFEGKPHLVPNMSLAIFNDGSTHAFNVKGEFRITIEEPRERKAFTNGLPFNLPQVIRNIPPESPMTVKLWDYVLVEDVRSVVDGEKAFFLTGEISYEDVFGMRHSTPFRFRWETYLKSKWYTSSYRPDPQWVDESPPST